VLLKSAKTPSPGSNWINGNGSATRAQRDAAALVQALVPYCRKDSPFEERYRQLRAKSESSLGL
jgi:hypothetical protein